MGKSCFCAYDIRGVYPEQVNEELAYRIGRFLPGLIGAEKIAVGRDVRLSGESLQKSLVRGLREAGCEVWDIGLCGTEMIYFAVPYLELDGGVMITASHNPKNHNGMKFVRRGSAPLPKELFQELERLVRDETLPPAEGQGRIQTVDIMPAYTEKLLSYVDMSSLKKYKVVVNAGSGCAGLVVEALEKKLPFEFVKLGCTPDGNFPQGVPNPLLPENQAATAEAVEKYGADFGVAWDGDFDRCFIYDERGRFINSCYMMGFLAEAFLMKEKGAAIVYDSRAVFNMEDIVAARGGTSVLCQGGHVFFKAMLRETGAVYGSEMSSHHYFRDFYCCDSGMIPWLLVAELLSGSGKRLSELFDERMARFPVSGEKNLKTENAAVLLAKVEDRYKSRGNVSKLDGLSVDMDTWRFNLRASHTEPLVRLNVESRGDRQLCMDKMREIVAMIGMIE